MVVPDLLGGDNMDYNQIGTVIFALGTTGWIPIWALFEGIAKCIRAFKGTDVTMEEFRNSRNHEWSDVDDEEDLGEDEPKEVNNTMEQKTKRTRVTTKTTKDSSQK